MPYFTLNFTGMGYIIVGMIIVFLAQSTVKSRFKKYSRIMSKKGYTGERAARIMLDQNGIRNVQIFQTSGSFTDSYDSSRRVIKLSQSVYDKTSLAAVSVACHEVGHAIQHQKSFLPLAIRQLIFPVVNLASKLTWPLVALGFFLLIYSDSLYEVGDIVFQIGIITMMVVIAFHVITLPVEFNASSRAIKQMVACGIIEEDEVRGAKKVLSAAAMTYVASLAMAIANLLRILAIRNRAN